MRTLLTLSCALALAGCAAAQPEGVADNAMFQEACAKNSQPGYGCRCVDWPGDSPGDYRGPAYADDTYRCPVGTRAVVQHPDARGDGWTQGPRGAYDARD